MGGPSGTARDFSEETDPSDISVTSQTTESPGTRNPQQRKPLASKKTSKTKEPSGKKERSEIK